MTNMEYLPDAMVVEAEWQANLSLARELEAMRANQKHRPPSDLFLEQARAAVTLRRLLQRRQITHVHATSSHTLLCAVFLKKLLGLTISATVEARPILTEPVLMDALDQCVGGRSNDRELLTQRGSGFLFDRTRKSRIDWIGGRNFWREWSQQLIGWTRRA
jgi:hypothetical protein